MIRTGMWIVPAAVIVILTMAVICSPAAATPRSHDGGFFLRLSAGGGGAGTKLDDPSVLVDMSGSAGNVNFAIGGIVAPNLAIHGTLFGWSISDPDVTFEQITGTLPGSVTLSAVGAGLTYYIMPQNIYFSGSAGVGMIEVESFGLTGNTENGLALDVTIGKEWWVSDRWGLGVAGALGYHSIPQESVDENWTGTDFCVRFTSTFN